MFNYLLIRIRTEHKYNSVEAAVCSLIHYCKNSERLVCIIYVKSLTLHTLQKCKAMSYSRLLCKCAKSGKSDCWFLDWRKKNLVRFLPALIFNYLYLIHMHWETANGKTVRCTDTLPDARTQIHIYELEHICVYGCSPLRWATWSTWAEPSLALGKYCQPALDMNDVRFAESIVKHLTEPKPMHRSPGDSSVFFPPQSHSHIRPVPKDCAQFIVGLMEWLANWSVASCVHSAFNTLHWVSVNTSHSSGNYRCLD